MRCVAVAFSGGRDSTALLHATLQAASPLGLNVCALHVHHGLMPEADDWLEHARRRCGRWRSDGHPLAFHFKRLEGTPAPGESVEAWARRHRYAALERMAVEAGASLVLLAHHRRDQAETVLLQLLRGAGPAGLAAMPGAIERGGLTWARPWLDRPREAIEAYVNRWRLSYVEDASNTAERYGRGRLRGGVWNTLQQAFPELEPALARSARRAQQADAALAELGQIDLRECRVGEGGLAVENLLALSEARQANALRLWWLGEAGRGAPDALIERLLRELPASARRDRPARWPAGNAGRGDERASARRAARLQVALYRGVLTLLPDTEVLGDGAAAAQALAFDRPGAYAIAPWPGHLIIEQTASNGISSQALRRCEARPRAGGEQFQLAAKGVARSLKKQYQQRGVAPWAREGPLLYVGERLVFAPGLGIDARAWAAPGAPQWSLRWCAEDTLG